MILQWWYLQMILAPVLHFINMSLVHLLNLSEVPCVWLWFTLINQLRTDRNVSHWAAVRFAARRTCFIALTCHGPHVGFVHQANLTLYSSGSLILLHAYIHWWRRESSLLEAPGVHGHELIDPSANSADPRCTNSILTQQESPSGDHNDLQVFPLSSKSTCRGRPVR